MKLFIVLILAIASFFTVGILDAKYLLVNVGNQIGDDHIDYPEKGNNQIVTVDPQSNVKIILSLNIIILSYLII